ncbi:MAG: xanthine dehydrogenase family protein molybdopterin-binding subunit, partial [Sulfobacillus sp.]
GTYEVPYQEHAYLQPEAAIGYIDDEGRVTIEIAGQWTRQDQEQIAHALDLPVDRIRVIYPAIGGAFGGREDMSMQIVLALAVWRLAEQGVSRPIRSQWSREESIIGHHKRHRGRIHARWGATNDGRVVVAEADCLLDAGPYYYTTKTVLGHLHITVSGPYDIPNLRVDSDAVYTHAVPGGAFRGFGAPQGAFVAETQLNKLAALLGIDPVEIRRINSLREGSIGATGTVMPPGVSLPTVIDRCAEESHWLEPPTSMTPFSPFASLPPDPRSVRRGRGFACALKNVGFSLGFPERCEARVILHGFDQIEHVELFSGAADVGQGSDTVLRQMTAEAVGVPTELVKAVFADTATGGDSGSSSASRMTFMGGNAILGACEEARERWLAGERPAVGWFRYVPPSTDALDAINSHGTPYFAYGYGADSVDLSVDIDTGHIVVHEVVCAVDVGRSINPSMIIGQIEGGVVQGHGYAVTENLQVHKARIVNPRFSTYLIPGILDVPDRVRSVIVEEADPRGPWGVRGMAEVPLIPYAPALVAALHDATGVWFDQIPLTPDRVRAHLRAHGVGS